MNPSLRKLHINPMEQYKLVSIKGKNSTADRRPKNGKMVVKTRSSGNPAR